MIGRSYNGTLPNASAATGVEGLTTIVPISAISSWYDYSRMGGVIGSTHYPAWLSNYVTDPDRQRTAPRSAAMSLLDGDADGNDERVLGRAQLPPGREQGQGVGVRHALPAGRQRRPGPVDRVVVPAGGQQRPAQAVALPRGSRRPVHDPPRRVDEPAPQWFDYWLSASRTGSCSSRGWTSRTPRTAGRRTPTGRSPAPRDVDVYLQGDTQATAGHARRRSRRQDGHAALDRPLQPERGDRAEHRGDHDAEQPPRLPVAAAEDRPAPLRLAEARPAPPLDKPQSNLTAMLVDYGPSTQITRSGDGIARPPTRRATAGARSSTRTGPDGRSWTSTPATRSRPSRRSTSPRRRAGASARGILDSSNRDSLYTDSRHAGRRVPVQLPDHAGRLHDPRRPSPRHRADGELQRAAAQRHDGHDDHAQHEGSKIALPVVGGV